MESASRKLFGMKIVTIRKRHGITQAKLSETSGIKVSALKCYELGTRHPKPKHFEAMARALEVRPEALDDYNINTQLQAIQALFQMEQSNGLRPIEIDGRPCIVSADGSGAMGKALRDWAEARQKLDDGRMTEDEYRDWKDAYSPYAVISAATGKEIPDPFTGKMAQRTGDERVPRMAYRDDLLSAALNASSEDEFEESLEALHDVE